MRGCRANGQDERVRLAVVEGRIAEESCFVNGLDDCVLHNRLRGDHGDDDGRDDRVRDLSGHD